MTIKHHCRILPNRLILNGKLLFESAKKPFELVGFLSETYNFLGIDYRKFFKMDALSKAGFLASELLLKDFDREQPKEDMGIIFFNRNSSLDADEMYQQTIRDFPSPAVFVYTLPNIVAGEIAIRNKIHGETGFYIMSHFQADTIYEIAKGALCNTDLRYLLTGWVEIYKGGIDVCLLLCEARENGQIRFNSKNIENIYAREQH
jgi:hypothetical protein